MPFVRKCLNIYCSSQRAGETVFFYLTFLGGIRMFKGSLNKDRRKKRHFYYSINTIMLLALLFVVKNKVVMVGSRANAIFGKYNPS